MANDSRSKGGTRQSPPQGRRGGRDTPPRPTRPGPASFVRLQARTWRDIVRSELRVVSRHTVGRAGLAARLSCKQGPCPGHCRLISTVSRRPPTSAPLRAACMRVWVGGWSHGTPNHQLHCYILTPPPCFLALALRQGGEGGACWLVAVAEVAVAGVPVAARGVAVAVKSW